MAGLFFAGVGVSLVLVVIGGIRRAPPPFSRAVDNVPARALRVTNVHIGEWLALEDGRRLAFDVPGGRAPQILTLRLPGQVSSSFNVGGDWLRIELVDDATDFGSDPDVEIAVWQHRWPGRHEARTWNPFAPRVPIWGISWTGPATWVPSAAPAAASGDRPR